MTVGGEVETDNRASASTDSTVLSGSFEHRGYRHSYEVYGSGDSVVLYQHGLLMDRQMNRDLAIALAEAGNRVILPDYLGHGESDRPQRASVYRMDAYAHDMFALLDHLEIDRAVVGGVSLGADVSLHMAAMEPERVDAMVLEMPVLEWAVPAAALLFTPLLLAMHYAPGPARLLSSFVERLPQTGIGALDSALRLPATPPAVIKAVLHGILTGPVAPTVEQRRAMDMPALVVAHTQDLLHPFSDAEALVAMLPEGQLVPARSMLELRITPQRLTDAIAEFLSRVGTFG